MVFVFLPNIMIIATSFLTRDDANLVEMVFTLDNYYRLFDPMYAEVLLHSINMALVATLACLILGYPFAFFLAKMPKKIQPLLLFLLIVPFWTNSLIRIYGLKIFLSTKGYFNEFLLWIGLIDKPLRIIYTPEAVVLGLVYILLPFMVMLPAMGLFFVADLMGGAKNLLIGNVIKSQFLNIRDWPFGAATSICLTLVMGLMLFVYYRAVKLLHKKVEIE